MAGTDITGLLEAVQKKINAVDSSASTGDLLRLLSAVRQSGTPSVFSYNGDEFPNLLDGTDDLQMLAYNLDSDKLYFQKDRWLAKVTPPPPTFQGSNYGYNSGGVSTNIIQKFSFTSDGNATDVGDLTTPMTGVSGQSSQTHGYVSGPGIINKFTFSTDQNATLVGNLVTSAPYIFQAGQSSRTFGYVTGGGTPNPYTNVIQKFPFAADTNATDVGDLTQNTKNATGQSAWVTDYGYNSGGASTRQPDGTVQNRIEKFSFTSDGNATDIANLTVSRSLPSGQSSETHGYTSGGNTPAATNVIDKFPFAADVNATDVGDLTVARSSTAGQSSTISGYASGGFPTSDTIDKFPFSSDANATDVGNLYAGQYYSGGQQY